MCDFHCLSASIYFLHSEGVSEAQSLCVRASAVFEYEAVMASAVCFLTNTERRRLVDTVEQPSVLAARRLALCY